MTDKTNAIANAHQIAARHGCEIQPGAFGRAALMVQPRHQQGDIEDRARLDRCREEMRRAGLAHDAATLL